MPLNRVKDKHRSRTRRERDSRYNAVQKASRVRRTVQRRHRVLHSVCFTQSDVLTCPIRCPQTAAVVV